MKNLNLEQQEQIKAIFKANDITVHNLYNITSKDYSVLFFAINNDNKEINLSRELFNLLSHHPSFEHMNYDNILNCLWFGITDKKLFDDTIAKITVVIQEVL